MKLNLQNAHELELAYRDMEKTFGARVLIQEMIPRGVELFWGIVNDSQFGLMLAIGLGGIFVEVLNDSKLLMLPTTRDDVRDVLLNLRGAKLLQGARGQVAVDIEKIIDAAMALGDFANDYADEIVAVDVNPLMALETHMVAVDALIITKDEGRRMKDETRLPRVGGVRK